MNNIGQNTPRAPIQYQPYCYRCRRSFVHDRALEQHQRASPRHNVCPGCDFDYITHDEMEECDCGSSAEEEEESDAYYEHGSAGTLSDDGGGGGEVHDGPTLAEQFTNTYYSVPGAWNGGTSTGMSETSSGRRAQPQMWSEFVEQTGDDRTNPWEDDPYGDDPYAWYDSEEYGSEAESASHSEMSSGQLDESELGSDAGRDGVQSPLTRATVTPYCQRCNRVFTTQNGLHQHHRMSSLHPWYCGTCQLDHDRELDLQRHVTTVHGGVPQTGNRQQQQRQQPVATGPPQQMTGWMTEFAAMVSGIRHISGAPPDADASTSTARGPRWAMSLPAPDSPPIIAPGELPQIPRQEVGREPVLTTDRGSSKASLVVSCPLCLDNVTALTTTLCGHVFCKECITAAIQHKPECPVCRAFTHLKSLHPIFLNVISS